MMISQHLLSAISYFDYAENYYHGFLTGLLSGIGDYEVVSNRENGTGRPDLILKTSAIRAGRVIILELKMAGNVFEMEDRCREALGQMEERRYAEPFLQEGYPIVLNYGVAFFKKECMVMKAEDK